MPIPRLFFVLWVCVPCLFIDDVTRSGAVALDAVSNPKEIYCQVLEEKKNTTTQSVTEELNVSVWSDGLLRPMQAVNGLRDIVSLTLQGDNVISFALFSIRVQQHTSRSKTDTVPIRTPLLSTDPSGFSATNAYFSKAGMKSHRKRFSPRPLLHSAGAIDDSVLSDPLSQKPSEFSDCHNCRFEFDLPRCKVLSLYG